MPVLNLLENYPLAAHTSWRVGGLARRCFKPNSIAQLSDIIQSLPKDEPVFFLGLGSNTLIRDGGVDGVVILTRGLSQLCCNQNIIQAKAGVSCATLARFAARNSIGGLEFLAGVPGTVGGALVMNAGAHGSETWDFVQSVQTMDKNGTLHTRFPSEYFISYRSAKNHLNEWIISASLSGILDNKMRSQEKIKQFLEHRKKTQPIAFPNGGCVFRNPPNDHAGRLIDQCGLKGLRIGGAMVSEKHANFIINVDNATAADIESLILRIRDTVYQQKHVQLQLEVKIIGQPLSQG